MDTNDDNKLPNYNREKYTNEKLQHTYLKINWTENNNLKQLWDRRRSKGYIQHPEKMG